MAIACRSPNRTILELKQEDRVKVVNWIRSSQSHHTGIETYSVFTLIPAGSSPNRTILELKQKRFLQLRLRSFHSQSHHTGIETAEIRVNID